MENYLTTLPSVLSITHFTSSAIVTLSIMGHVQIWQALLADEDVIAMRFDVYDKNQSGELDSSQVAEALKDLNG
eukprot:COSAG03_NODE_18432_length_355_cov_0.792969_1_plen_73_part_10